MRRLTLYCGVVCLGLLAFMDLATNVRVEADGETIVGTWIMTTSPTIPPGATPIVFQELISFNPGGTYTDTHAIAHSSQLPFLPPSVAVDSSDAFGVWRRTSDSNQFAATHKRLLFAGPDTPSAFYGPFVPGQNVGFETVQILLTLQDGPNGETLSGPFTVEYTNLAGQLIFFDTGSVSAKPLAVEPLATP